MRTRRKLRITHLFALHLCLCFTPFALFFAAMMANKPEYSHNGVCTAVIDLTSCLPVVPLEITDLFAEPCPFPISEIETRLIRTSASSVVLRRMPARVFVDRPFDVDLAIVHLCAGATGSVAHCITSHARLEIELSFKSTRKSPATYSVPLSAHFSDGGIIARALIHPASWADADSVKVTSLTLGGHAVLCGILPATLGVGYNHARTRAGAVTAAAKVGDARALQAVLDAGGSTEEEDEERNTPLLWAALRGHLEALQILLAAGANAKPRSKGGWTPLHWAATYGHAPVVALLLATPGVDPLARTSPASEEPGDACPPATPRGRMDEDRETPLDCALRNRETDAAALLQADSRVAAAIAAKRRRGWGPGGGAW